MHGNPATWQEESAQRTLPATLRSIDARIAHLVRDAVVARIELRRAQIGHASIHRRVRDGRLHAVLPHVYATAPWARLSHASRMRAITLSIGPGCAISHETAAVAWRIWPEHRVVGRCGIDVLTPTRHVPLPGTCIHRTRHLDLPYDTVVVDGVRRTTVARTIVDLGAVLTPWQLAHVCHEANFWHKPRRAEIEAILVRMGTARNVSVVRKAMRLIDEGSSGTHSGLEDTMLTWLLERGVVEPRVNRHAPMSDGGTIRVDLCWLAQRIIIEVDGSGHVGRAATEAEDKERARRILASGYTLMRLTAWQVRHADRLGLLARLPRRRRSL